MRSLLTCYAQFLSFYCKRKPPRTKPFIENVTTTPFDNIEEALKRFLWDFEKGDFHHWVDLFNHFDAFFEKYIKPRKDLQLEVNDLEADPPFPREAVLQILRVIRIILENCTNKHFYSSYEHHLSSLLACTDADIVEACLQTLAAFLKKTIGKYILRDASLNSKLLAFAQGWGGKEEGLGLVVCAVQNVSDKAASELGSSLHFEFYSLNDYSKELQPTDQHAQGLQIIDLPDINVRQESDLVLLSKLVLEYKVPLSLRFSLLTRLRFARAFTSLASRQQYTCIRLYAFIVLVQACGDSDDMVSFFNNEPEFINELVTLLSYETVVPEKIRVLSILSLVAVCQDRARQPTVLTAVTSGGHRGILSSLMQKAIDSILNGSSKWSVVFAEALLSLVTVLVSSSSGCSAMREAGFIPTLLPLLKDMDPQHLHLVSMAVHVLEAFMDYSNPAATLFRDLGGLDDTILRLKLEVSHVENGFVLQNSSVDLDMSDSTGSQVVANTSSELDTMHPLYSEALVAYHCRLLIKALLRAISLGTYAPGATARISGSEESLLPHCLSILFRRAKDFGGGVFSLAATVMSDLIHKDPTCFAALEAAGLPSTFIDAIMDGVVCSAEAIGCIPQCLDALCLNNNGLKAVKERNALMCFVKIFTSRTYMRALTADTLASLSSGLDELMRHASPLRVLGVDMLIEILNTLARLGSETDSASSSADPPNVSVHVPMETDADDKCVDLVNEKVASAEQANEASFDASSMNTESFLPDCISNAARLLEAILQNSDTCRIFVEKKGIEAVMHLFTLPSMPLSVSVGQSISVAFKNFSHPHSASLARAVCSFLREHLTSTLELLISPGGVHLGQVEPSKRLKVARYLSNLDGILSLANSLLKVTTAVVSELGTADSEVLKDLGGVYREILWQVSLYCDSKVDEKQSVLVESESPDVGVSNTSERGSDEDANTFQYRLLHPASVRSSTHSPWAAEREFLSVVRSTEGFNRRMRHGIARARGGRSSRHLEALQIDSESMATLSESSSQDLKKKSLEDLVLETVSKLALTIRTFFTSLVKGFSSPNRRRNETFGLSSASKCIGTALSKVFLEALVFSGYSTSSSLGVSLSLKCRYLGKVVDDILPLIFDNRRSTCYTAMINYFYVHGTFKEILTTFEATSQLLWTLPLSFPSSGSDHHKAAEDSKLSQNLWLIETLQSYCRLLDHFVNPALVFSSTSASQSQLLVQPVAVGLSIGLFSVPKEPKVFIRMLQSQVMEVILPIWNHHLFASCSPGFITSIISLMTRVYCGVGDVKQSRSGFTGSSNQRLAAPPPDEGTIGAIVEMGFSRSRAEEALRRVETNSVEMAMEWLFSHAEDPVQEEDELARALALSLGNSVESSKVDSREKSLDVLGEEQEIKTPHVDDILATALRLFYSSESVSFSLTDLLLTLCSRNKGEDRSRVISYLVQQLNVCPMEFSKDNSALCMVSHTLALLLSEDESAQDDAVRSGIVSAVMNILTIFMTTVVSGSEIFIPRSLSSLLLILCNLLQSRPKISGENVEETVTGVLPASFKENASSPLPEAVAVKNSSPAVKDEESDLVFEKVFGKPRGFLTIDESRQLLSIACNLIKQHVPAMVMQAVLLLCSRLTKTHALAKLFIETGGLDAIFDIPRSCFFPGYDKVTSSIIRHLIEDPQTLQSAMESEIRQVLGGNRHASRLSVRAFLISTAPVICRDPGVFMKAAAAVCQLESSGGRTTIVLSKERDKEKEKEKAKTLVGGSGLFSNESFRITENKALDGSAKCPKVLKKVPVNLTLVVDHLLEILLAFPSEENEENNPGCPSAMVVDACTKNKGKSKIDETRKVETDNASEKTAGVAKVSFVLKLLTDILLMYVHATGVILKRDHELSQPRASNQTDYSVQGGVVHRVLHRLLPLAKDKSAGLDEWREKLSEKASYFLVILSSRSSEGRRRVINELVKALSVFPNSESNSSQKTLFPSKEILVLVDLVYAILSKNSSSGNLPGSGCSPDVAKSMIDGGMVQSLSSILQVIDLDHPDAPKIVNIILKALESLTRAANSSEHLAKFDSLSNKNSTNMDGRSDGNLIATSDSRSEESNGIRDSQAGVAGATSEALAPRESFQNGTDQHRSLAQPAEQEMRIGEENENANHTLELGMDFVREDMVEGSVMNDREQIGMPYHVENQVDDEMGDEDDEMGDEGEEDEDDDEEEDGFIVEDDNALMSLADTDVEDHDDTGLGDEYTEDMVDEEDDDFHENRVIEVRWREALGLDRLQVLGQPGAGGGLIDVSAEPFEGVNVDDLFGLRRTFGFERRRQTSRTSFERPASSVTSLQHPLLQRPSQSSDVVSSMWSGSQSSSREIEAFSRNLDASHFSTLDAPVLPYDNAMSAPFGERSGGSVQPPLPDFSVGLESLRIPGRRGLGDDRWSDDGQPLSGGQVSLIAQTIEEEFISRLSCTSDNPLTRVSTENTALPELQQADAVLATDSQLPPDGDTGSQQNCDGIQDDGRGINHLREGYSAPEVGNSEGANEQAEHRQVGESTAHLISEVTPDIGDDMEIGGESVNPNQQLNEVPSLLEPSCSQADVVGGVSSEVNVNPHNMPYQVVGNGNHWVAESHSGNNALSITASEFPNVSASNGPSAYADDDMSGLNMVSAGANQANQEDPVSTPNTDVPQEATQANDSLLDTDGANGNCIDPTFLEALPEDLRAEVLASQQAQHSDPPTSTPPTADDIDPEFLAALPPDIQAEVLAQQRAQRVAQQAAGQPVDMDNASIIATFPAELREEVLLTSSEAVLSALPSPLLAEAQMLRDRAMSHYQARSLFGSSHRLNNRRNNLGFDRQAVIDRGVGVTIGTRVPSSVMKASKLQEVEGEQLLDASSLKALIRLLRLAQPLGKGLLQRLLLNLCAHSSTRANLVRLLLDTINPQQKDSVGGSTLSNSFRLYGCKSNVVYSRSQVFDGLPPLVLHRVLEILTYLANNHCTVASLLCFFDRSLVPETLSIKYGSTQKGKGKEKILGGDDQTSGMACSDQGDIPLILFLKLLNQPLFLRSIGHLEQVMGLIHVVVHTAASKWESQSHKEDMVAGSLTSSGNGVPCNIEKDVSSLEVESSNKGVDNTTTSKPISRMSIFDIFLQLPQPDLRNLCSLLGHEGLSDKVYLLTGEVVKKLASVASPLCKCFILELSGLAQELSSSAVNELITLRTTHMLGLSAGSMAGSAVLRVLQILSSFTSATSDSSKDTKMNEEELEEHATMLKLNVVLEPLWRELSECISSMETELAQGSSSSSSALSITNPGDHPQASSVSSLPPGTQRLLPFIEALFVLCEKLQANNLFVQTDLANETVREVKEFASSSDLSSTKNNQDAQRRVDGTSKFTRFAEKHRRLLNAFVRQNPGLLEKSLSMLLKAPRLIDFDNKRAYFRSRIRQQHEQHLSGPLRISIRRAYVLEDSYNQLRMRPTQDLKGRLNVHFQAEEGIDAGGLTREWYQLLSRVIFDKGALLFTTVGNNATFQPNPNSVYQTEHLSYFRFVGRVVAKALFDGQLLDVYFTRSFYKHILGVKVTYHDIEAVDPDYYKNLKWMLENDVSDIPDLTFSMDADEEKHILYEKAEVTDYELKPGGRNIRVTEETKQEYVDLVADHILTNAIRPQINSFLVGFNELVPRDIISIFNDKELELLISGLPEIDLDDLKANAEYTGYTAASGVIQWFWEVVFAFSKEDRARLLQFVTGTSKVPLEGFKALQGISGPQIFQIHKAYGAPERLPSAHTCFNQLDLPEYTSKEQLQERLLLAIHEASEGFGFG